MADNFPRGICRICGCTWDKACINSFGTCWWTDSTETLCSECVDHNKSECVDHNKSEKEHVTSGKDFDSPIEF